MTVSTRYEHIVIDMKNVAYIKSKKIKVILLVLNQLTYYWSLERERIISRAS